MTRHSFNRVAELKEENERLKRELDNARDDILELRPRPISDQFRVYRLCKNNHEQMVWWYETIKMIIDSTKPDPEYSNEWTGDRADCPLCGDGNSWHHNGFSLPEGLKRHLEGSSKARQCAVMKIADEVSRDYLEENAKQTA